jgi:dihydroxyacid dehydratase/phosphogluconate dehydratase
MNAKTNIKKRLPNRHVTDGRERAPHRSYLYAMGPTSQNAAVVVAASGGSTNAALHLPAIAPECRFDLFDETKIFKKTPYVADLKPGGPHVAKDVFKIGGLPRLVKALLGYAVVGTLNVKLTDPELVEPKTKWKPRATNHRSGALWKYAQQVGPAVDGAVTHPGGAHEKQCYADI